MFHSMGRLTTNCFVSITDSMFQKRNGFMSEWGYLNAALTMSNAPVSKDAPKDPHLNIIKMLCLTGW
ncbi:hypothetical protein SAMN06295998_108121 [Primorskyibacter flagellatus]|uniref:Uncharacterized protein n=1 Tax=Primorskyibacter flagellatus TaxID=1387277 RepID=A0A1W2CPZ6_9RHOB|nr:hypothetical protein SAMN06295998_108121 [Primorskyibacter flagellatus]